MDTNKQAQQDSAKAVPLTVGQHFGQWLDDPMGGVIAASVATIGSFGVVLSGIWAINVALN
jgi:hypothetical protein